MTRRLSVLLRGPGVMIIILAAIVAVTLVTQRANASSHRHAATATPRPAASATPQQVASATPRPSSTPAPTRTAILRPTPRPVPVYAISVSGQRSYVDRATGTSVVVNQEQVLPSSRKIASTVTVLFRVAIRHPGARKARYNRRNFYLIADSGQTYGTVPASGVSPALRSGTIPPSGTSGWIRFDLPARPQHLSLIWNDDNRLLPPATVGRIAVRRVSS